MRGGHLPVPHSQTGPPKHQLPRPLKVSRKGKIIGFFTQDLLDHYTCHFSYALFEEFSNGPFGYGRHS